MKKLLLLVFLFPLILTAQIRYVATDGDDTGAGTIGDPYLTWQKGIDETHAGDTLYIRGGVYMSYARVRIDTTYYSGAMGHSGTPTKPILIAGYPADITADNWPILDCKVHCDSITSPYGNVYNSAIVMYKVQYITLKCLEIRNVYQCDSVNSGAIDGGSVSNMTFERLKVHNVGSRAFFVTSGAWSYADSAWSVDGRGFTPEASTPIWPQPDTTRYINCDVWDICDTLTTSPGNAGDGWKPISYKGNYQLFDGCRAWNYSDDGFDPSGGQRVFRNCWAMASNKYNNIGAGWTPELNGFKTSANTFEAFLYYTYADSLKYRNDSLTIHTNCLAMFCGGVGFYHGAESDYTDNPRLYNNTFYKCEMGISSGIPNLPYDTLGDIYRNNISYGSTGINAIGGPDDVFIYIAGSDPKEFYVESNNSWRYRHGYPDSEPNPAFTITDADFVTVDSATLVALFIAPRQADGSLPVLRPLMLAETSDLIDGAGVVTAYGDDLGYVDYVDAGSDIVANFSASDVFPGTTEIVTFTDLSTNSPDTWAWIFENGTPATSAVQNPVIQYNTAGTHNVQLIASLGADADTLLRTNYITVTDIPVSAFSGSSTSIVQGQSVVFTDASTNTPTSWSWVCPGGTPSTSSAQNPTITYNSVGVHTVTLTATNAGGSDAEIKTNYITVTATPTVSEYKITIQAR